MTEAPLTRSRPRIDHPAKLDRIVKQIVAKVDPVAIYLFGSRARGDANEDSDYDLMVVMPDDITVDRELHDRVWQAARVCRIGATPFLSTQKRFAWRRHEVGTLEYEVETDGQLLYPELSPSYVGLGRTGAMNVNVVEEWLRRVERDLAAAQKCNEGDDAVPDQAAYHVQQAAEKLTKAALVAQQLRPPKGHEIQKLTPLLAQDFPLKARFRRLERFSDYAWAHRYPTYPGQEPLPEPSVAEAGAWLDEVRALKADFERWLKEKTGGKSKGRVR